MDTCPEESWTRLETSAWQATASSINCNLKDFLQLAMNKSVMCYHPAPKRLTIEAVCMMCFILIFTALTVIGSLITACEYTQKDRTKELSQRFKKKKSASEVFSNSEEDRKSSYFAFYTVWTKNCQLLLNCFCVRKNGKRLLSISSKNQHLHCLDGIRAIGLTSVILCHTFGLYINALKESKNMWLESFTLKMVAKGLPAVDVFFILSGILNGYLISVEYQERDGKISWLSFPIRRFIKLTPIQLIVVGFYTTLFSYIGSGPLWPKYDTNPVCKNGWIWNLFYLNNFLPNKEQCMISNWYIACLMQMHVISPIFLIPLMRTPKIGYALTLFAMIGCYLTHYALVMKFNLENIAALSIPTESTGFVAARNLVLKYFDIFYTKPYARLSGYLVGIVLGCYLHKRKSNNIEKNSKVVLFFGWTIFLILIWLCFFTDIRFQGPTYEKVAFHVIKHFFYACSLSWIIFVCVTGQRVLLNNVLSSKFLGILSNLSYNTYLVHMMVLEKYFLSLEELTEHSLQYLIMITVYLILWCFALSFMVSLIFGLPVIRIYETFYLKLKNN